MKPQCETTTHLLEQLELKGLMILSTDKTVEQLECSHISGGNAHCPATLENILMFLLKFNRRFLHGQPTLRCLLRRNEMHGHTETCVHVTTQRETCVPAQGGITPRRAKPGRIQMFIHQRMDARITGYAMNE